MVHAADHVANEQTGFFKYLDVFGYRRLRDRKVGRDFSDGERPADEFLHDAPARGVG